MNQAETALRAVLKVVQDYLPPDGLSEKDALCKIIEIVDPWPLSLHSAPSAALAAPVASHEPVDVESVAAKHGYSHDAAFYRGFHAGRAIAPSPPTTPPAAQPAEPLPCPFCGSSAQWSHHSDYTHGYGDEPRRVYRWQSSLSCSGCRLPHCSGFGTVAWEGGNALAQQYAMKRACEQWNRRAAIASGATQPSEPSDVCTDAQNCRRCKTPPKLRGSMEHAGIKNFGLATPPTVEPLTAPSDAVKRGMVRLDNVIRMLRENGRFEDEEGEDTNDLQDLYDALAANAAPTESKPALTEAQMEVLMFLWGVGDLDGCGYGDQNPREKGRYWWRKQLQTAFPQIVERHRASLPPHPTGGKP